MNKLGTYITACLSSAVIGGLVSGIVATYLARQTATGTSEAVVTKKLVIVDQAGHERATLDADKNQQVSLDLFAPDHTRQVSLGVTQNPFADPTHSAFDAESGQQKWAPILELYDEAGRESARFTTTDHGNARLSFYDQRGSFRQSLGYIGDGTDYGRDRGAWGLRVRKGFSETQLGILDYDTHDGPGYLSPVTTKR